jgi:hypothetical protein
MLGVLARFCPIIVQVTPLKTPFGLVTPFITISITRSYNHTQLLLTPLRGYTITILAYNHLLHGYTVDYQLSVLSVFDSSARLVLLLPTTDCCLRRLAHWPSSPACSLTLFFAGWLADSLSSPAGSWLSLFVGWLADWLYSPKFLS